MWCAASVCRSDSIEEKPLSLITGTHLGRYEIRSKLGAGGTGEVYLAEDTRLHRKVALKILPAEVALNQKLRVQVFSLLRSGLTT